jgi:hypothetical protein
MKWIETKNKKPRENQWVICNYGGPVPIIACYKGTDIWLAADFEQWSTDDGITHWMPLPKPPN